VNDPAELKPMLTQFPGEEMQSWAVGKVAGNVRNQGPQLMEPNDALADLKFG
jgi:putative SOS response-associated peptidase YedK